VRSQNLQIDDQLLQFSERRGHLGISPRRLQVQVETVLPWTAVHRPALDLQQIQFATCKRLERVVERSGLGIELKNQRQLVRILWHVRRFGEQEKARVILAIVLEMLAEDRASVDLRRASSRDRSSRPVARTDHFADAASRIFSGDAL